MTLEEARPLEIRPRLDAKVASLNQHQFTLKVSKNRGKKSGTRGKTNRKSQSQSPAQLEQRHTLVRIYFVVHALLSLSSHYKRFVVSRCCIAKRLAARYRKLDDRLGTSGAGRSLIH